MKKLSAAVVVLVLLHFARVPAMAQTGDPRAELSALVQDMHAKMMAGKRAEGDFIDELRRFDALVAEHQAEKTDAVAQILMTEAMFYFETFQDTARGEKAMAQLKYNFPDTTQGRKSDDLLASMEGMMAGMELRKSMVAESAFPDFSESDMDGAPLSVAAYKGKVVLVDFWATWCGPCCRELPNVANIYSTYHDKGFEIIGVSLDSNKDRLAAFLQSKGYTWRQYFDGLGWQNKLAAKYGVRSIPSTFLIDRDGKIIGSNLRGEELAAAVGKAVGGS